MTFTLTHLGHQGWLVSAGGSHVLIDPVLTSALGHSPHLNTVIWPPRQLSVAELPPINAIVVTHEHEDHLSAATLAQVDKGMPLLLSSRSSSGSRRFLRELGFDVHLFVPGRTWRVGQLRLLGLSPSAEGRADEFDTLPFLVYDAEGHGSFFSNVDVLQTDAMLDACRQRVERPGLWNSNDSNIAVNWVEEWTEAEWDVTPKIVQSFLLRQAQSFSDWVPPEAWVVTGSGLSLTRNLAYLNDRVFPFDAARAVEQLSRLIPEQRFEVSWPGRVFQMREGKVIDTRDEARFLTRAPRESWPARVADAERFQPSDWPAPAVTSAPWTDAERTALATELQRFASYLYGRSLFVELQSHNEGELDGLRPTFVFRTQVSPGGPLEIWEYLPFECDFRRCDVSDPAEWAVAGCDIGAHDLLALLRCDLSAGAIALHRLRLWNRCAEVLSFDLQGPLMRYPHPLRFPDRHYQMFRARAAEALTGASPELLLDAPVQMASAPVEELPLRLRRWHGSPAQRRTGGRQRTTAFDSDGRVHPSSLAPVSPNERAATVTLARKLESLAGNELAEGWRLGGVLAHEEGKFLLRSPGNDQLIAYLRPYDGEASAFKVAKGWAVSHRGVDLPSGARAALSALLELGLSHHE